MLTAEQLTEIKRKLRKGDITKIALALKVSRQAIYYVLWQKSGSHRIIDALLRATSLRDKEHQHQLQSLEQALSITA